MNMENYLREFIAARISLNKVHKIKSREFKAERILIQVRYSKLLLVTFGT